ncbi:MAG: glycosyltransferase family A protein [Rikenellaceae bacterium]
MLISIIIPVYNTVAYLDECLRSVLSQSYNNFELLLIDDGSSDGSGEICDKYAKCDSRIKVFHKENGGVSSARNLGLEVACGSWVVFLDGDDFLQPEALEKAVLEANNGCDIILCYATNSNEPQKKLYEYNSILKNSKIASNELFLRHGYTRGSVMGSFYNREFLNRFNIRFVEGIQNNEDSYFFGLAQHYASYIYLSDIYFYIVNVREGSASRSWDGVRVEKMIDSIVKFETDIKNRATDYKTSPILNYKIYELISACYNKLCRVDKSRELSKQLMQTIKSTSLYPINIKNMPIQRFKIRLLNTSILLFEFLVRIKS